MHPSFLPLLRCPRTGQALRLEADEQSADGSVLTGRLVAPDGTTYPIIRGIPRFVPDECYVSSFGYEWRRWARVQFEDQNQGRPMQGYTRQMFERITAWGKAELEGATVLDLGCGPGRFLDICRSFGARVVGLDMSEAVESARANFPGDPDVLIIQADALNPPLAPQSFDFGYSIGVLHHSPAPGHGLAALSQAVRSGGEVCCCVYSRGSDLYDSPAVARMRRLHRKLKRHFGVRPALAYSYFAAYPLHWLLALPSSIPLVARLVTLLRRHLLPMVHLPDGRWRVLDIFDAITPEHASTHTPEELREWFRDAGCVAVKTMPWGPTAMCGRKG